MKRLAQLFHPSIARKLIFGFLICGIPTLFIALLALYSLQRLNEINDRIFERVSFPIMTIAISVVTNEYCSLQNHVQVGEVAAER